MSRRAYLTDLSDAEYACLEPHLPAPLQPGRPRVYFLREDLVPVYSSHQGARWRVEARTLEEAINKVQRVAE